MSLGACERQPQVRFGEGSSRQAPPSTPLDAGADAGGGRPPEGRQDAATGVDGGALDAGHGRDDAGAGFVDYVRPDGGEWDAGMDMPPHMRPDAGPLCIEGEACELAADVCRHGFTHCSEAGPVCEAVGEFVAAATECGNSKVCDGLGHCVACGGLDQPCCGSTCSEGVCDEGGRCLPCTPGAACRLATQCLLGEQACDGQVRCVLSGSAAEGTSCGSECGESLCACDGAGACQEAGGDGELCVGGACAAGAICNADTDHCFACDEGVSCAPDNACADGIEVCSSGARVCQPITPKERGVGCGDALACDGHAECVACGAVGEPCCGESCGDGLICHPASKSCVACAAGAACISDNGCRTGSIVCEDGAGHCVEDDDVARATACGGSATACDGAGLCTACGGPGQPCCGESCEAGAFCDVATGTCGSCEAGGACAAEHGCGAGSFVCADGVRSCAVSTFAARGTSCDAGAACDGAGDCAACGGAGRPCCGGVCGAETVCDGATNTCVGCPADMVFIPAGSFEMGAADTDPDAEDDERPVHTVTLPPFCIDVDEVDHGEFGAYGPVVSSECNAGDWYTPHSPSSPVNCVDWNSAKFFCEHIGKRLPTEAEWEYAATGGTTRRYPWGDEAPDCERANISMACTGIPSAPGADTGDVSPFAVRNMAGSLREWVSDQYKADYYSYPDASGESPIGPPDSLEPWHTPTQRGGSFKSSAQEARSTARNFVPQFTYRADFGFRCAEDLP